MNLMTKETFESLVRSYLELRFSTRFWEPWEDYQDEAKKVLIKVMEEFKEWKLLETPFTCGNSVKPTLAARLIKIRWSPELSDVEINVEPLLRVLFSHPPIFMKAPAPEWVKCSECGKQTPVEPVFPGSGVLLPPEGWMLGPVHSQCPDC